MLIKDKLSQHTSFLHAWVMDHLSIHESRVEESGLNGINECAGEQVDGD